MEGLLRLSEDLQAKLGRRVSHYETITVLAQRSQGVGEARDCFQKLYGAMKDDRQARKNLGA